MTNSHPTWLSNSWIGPKIFWQSNFLKSRDTFSRTWTFTNPIHWHYSVILPRLRWLLVFTCLFVRVSLYTLQKRTKGKVDNIKVEVNDVVLIADDDKKPLCWPLGKIIAIHPGTDGITRTVTAETATGVYKRPVVKLRLLPLKASVDEELATVGQGGGGGCWC